MINTFRLLSLQNLRGFRQFHKCIIQRVELSAVMATEATDVALPSSPSSPPPSLQSQPTPSPSGAEKRVSDKIDKIANDITALNLIEVAELSDLLKKRLNLPDAPVMPVGFMAAPQAAEEEEVETQKRVKTEFTVKLASFDDKQKIALIKEIKNQLPNTNLVQAKKFVESAPVVVKTDISKEEAEKLKEALTKVGAAIEII